jgi:hypothetical protein
LYSSTDQGGGKAAIRHFKTQQNERARQPPGLGAARRRQRLLCHARFRSLIRSPITSTRHWQRLPGSRCLATYAPSITTVTEFVHGPTGLQTQLANARNRTRIDCTSRGSGNGAGAAARGDSDVRRRERAYLVGAENRLVHSQWQWRAPVPAAGLLPETMLWNGRAAPALPERRRRRPRTR